MTTLTLLHTQSKRVLQTRAMHRQNVPQPRRLTIVPLVLFSVSDQYGHPFTARSEGRSQVSEPYRAQSDGLDWCSSSRGTRGRSSTAWLSRRAAARSLE